MKKRYLCTLLLAVLFLNLPGCQKNQITAEQGFAQMMQTLASGDLDTASKYYAFDGLSIFPEAENRRELMNALLRSAQKASYTIYQSETSGREVHLNLLLTAPDGSALLDRYLTALTELTGSRTYQAQLSSTTASEYQTLAAEKLIQILNEDSIPLSDHTIDITLVKKDGQWMVTGGQDAFFDILFAGIGKSADAIL